MGVYRPPESLRLVGRHPRDGGAGAFVPVAGSGLSPPFAPDFQGAVRREEARFHRGARLDGGTPGSHVAGTREQAEGDEGEHAVGDLPFDRGLGVADPWRGGAGRRWYGISWRGYTTISAPFY